MIEETNDEGGDPATDIKRQTADAGPDKKEPGKAEKLSSLSSDELDEVEQ